MNEAHPMLRARYCSAQRCMQIIDDDQELKSHWSDISMYKMFEIV